MPLNFKLKSRDEAPAELANLYVERDGAFVLDVEGAVDKAKLDEFRTTNVALLKERDELKQRFEGIDPEEVKQLKEAHQKAEEEKLLGRSSTSQNGEDEADKERKLQAERERIEKVIEGRVKSIKGDLEKQVAQLTTERDASIHIWPLSPFTWP